MDYTGFNDYGPVPSSQLAESFQNDFARYESPSATAFTGGAAVEDALSYVQPTWSDGSSFGTSAQPDVSRLSQTGVGGFESITKTVTSAAKNLADVFTSFQQIGLAKEQFILNREVAQGNVQIARDRNAASVQISKARAEGEVAKANAIAQGQRLGAAGSTMVAQASQSPALLWLALAGLGFTIWKATK